MTTQQYLASKGVSMDQAETFIMDNLDHPDTIYNVCRDFGVNNDMIADIVQTDFPGVNGTIVSNFFDSNGFDGSALGFTQEAAPGGIQGNIDFSNLTQYSDIILVENVSQTAINETSSYAGHYAYASNSTWNGIQDLGITSAPQDFLGIEMASINDDSTTVIGLDMLKFNDYAATLNAYGLDLGSVASEFGLGGLDTSAFDLGSLDAVGVAQYQGDYDLVVAL